MKRGDHDQQLPGIQAGTFVALDPLALRCAYITVIKTAAGLLPPDDDFPTEYENIVSGQLEPMEDTPLNRGMFKASKLFDDEAERISFLFRFTKLIGLALTDRRYARYRDDGPGPALHIALLTAVAVLPFSRRTPTKDLKARLHDELQRTLAGLEKGGEETRLH